jgi:hypothetical protein
MALHKSSNPLNSNQDNFPIKTQLKGDKKKNKKLNKTNYTCIICDKTILGLARVKLHMKSHNRVITNDDVSQYAKISIDQTGTTASYYTCYLCDKTSKGFPRFKQHMESSHEIVVTNNDASQYAKIGYEEIGDEKPKTAAYYTCNLCEKTALGFFRFKQHMDTHDIVISIDDAKQYAQIGYDISFKNVPVYTCDICEKSIHGLSRFRQHYVVHAQEFDDQEDINNFMQDNIIDDLPVDDPLNNDLVEGENVHDFDIADLKEEVEDSEVNNALNGGKVSESLKSEIVLEERDDGTLLLQNQDENFPILDEYRLELDNEEILNNEDILSIEKKGDCFECDVCNKSFVSRQGLWKHNKAYHESEVPKETKPKLKTKASHPLKWSCSVCAEAFSSRVRLVAHRKVSHPKAKADDSGNKCPAPGILFITL